MAVHSHDIRDEWRACETGARRINRWIGLHITDAVGTMACAIASGISAKATGGASIAAGTNAVVADWSLLPAETANLLGSYRYTVEVTDSDSRPYRVTVGEISFAV
jgi:hypothetical protein